MLISDSNSALLYEQNRLANVFDLPTFQEYLNNLIQHTTDYSDLKKFNDNMKTKSFYGKLQIFCFIPKKIKIIFICISNLFVFYFYN